MTFIEPGAVPDPGTNPEPIRRTDPLATSANWWDLPPLAPEELEVPGTRESDVHLVAPTHSAPGYQQPLYAQPASQPGGFSEPFRFGAPEPRVGATEALVAHAPRKSMEHNELGQRSLLIGLALSLVFVVSTIAKGSAYSIALFAFAAIGVGYGVRGLNAANRGLATNRRSSIVGIVLAVGFSVAELIVWIVNLNALVQDIPGR